MAQAHSPAASGAHHAPVRTKSKSNILMAVIITAIVVIILSYMVFAYMPEQTKKKEVNNYKKAIFKDMQCQYNCKLKNQSVNNVTQLVPDLDCVQGCATTSDTKLFDPNNYANNDLTRDSLINDTTKALNNCRDVSTNESTKRINNEALLECARQSLESIKTQYPYLQ